MGATHDTARSVHRGHTSARVSQDVDGCACTTTYVVHDSGSKASCDDAQPPPSPCQLHVRCHGSAATSLQHHVTHDPTTRCASHLQKHVTRVASACLSAHVHALHSAVEHFHFRVRFGYVGLRKTGVAVVIVPAGRPATRPRTHNRYSTNASSQRIAPDTVTRRVSHGAVLGRAYGTHWASMTSKLVALYVW